MISKQLLAKVLKTIVSINMVDQIGDTVHWQGTSIEGNLVNGSIDIYKLAMMCKVVSLRNKYELTSRVSLNSNSSCNAATLSQYLEEGRWFNASTETEAIFKAAEWALRNIK